MSARRRFGKPENDVEVNECAEFMSRCSGTVSKALFLSIWRSLELLPLLCFLLKKKRGDGKLYSEVVVMKGVGVNENMLSGTSLSSNLKVIHRSDISNWYKFWEYSNIGYGTDREQLRMSVIYMIAGGLWCFRCRFH